MTNEQMTNMTRVHLSNVPKGKMPAYPSLILRGRILDSSKRVRKRKVGLKMATYRVILRIDVYEEDIIRSRGKETLKELKESEDDCLRAHVENEMGWLEQSFSRLETESVTRLSERRHTPKSESVRKSKK